MTVDYMLMILILPQKECLFSCEGPVICPIDSEEKLTQMWSSCPDQREPCGSGCLTEDFLLVHSSCRICPQAI